MPLPPPDKYDLELEVDGFFHNGDKKDVARLLQKDSSTISRQLSPNQEHNNHIVFFFVSALWAFDSIRRELGDKVLNVVLRERAKWLNDDIQAPGCPAVLTKNVGIQFSEFAECRMKGKSLDDQIDEATDIITAATNLQASLIQHRNAERFGINGNGKPISTEIHDSLKPVVKDWKAKRRGEK